MSALGVPQVKHHSHHHHRHHNQSAKNSRETKNVNAGPNVDSPPVTTGANKASGSFDGDVRSLPQTPPKKQERPKRPDPVITPKVYVKPIVH
jgi:hypothetical protein